MAATTADGAEVVVRQNWRNLKVVAAVAVLLLANVSFHAESHFDVTSDYGRRLAIAASVFLIMLIGGRIVPSFARNWLMREYPGRLVPYGRFDAVALSISLAALASWFAMTGGPVTGGGMLLSGGLQCVRLARCAAHRTLRDPLVAVLHLADMFVPAAAAVHAFRLGAVETMTRSVMVRATLGHTGQALRARRAGVFIFAAVGLAATARIAVALIANIRNILLTLAAGARTSAFLGFAIVYGPMLPYARISS